VETLIAPLIFLVCLFVIELVFYSYRAVRNPDNARIKKRIKKIPSIAYQRPSVDIVRKRSLSSVGWFNLILLKFPGIKRLDVLHTKANVAQPLGLFILASLFLFSLSLYLGPSIFKNWALSMMAAFLAGYMPFFYLQHSKNKRMAKFERQLPDALELVGRALRAGHAFSGGVRMVADEFDDPVGTEFDRTLDEINFGVGVTEALLNLSSRVDCADLRYFIVSVIIQRETGGNLSEVVENIAHLIRERFKLRGRIRVLAAEGKFSAIVLVVLPFFIAGALFFFNRKYISVLQTDPVGRWLVVGALVMIAVGSMVMWKMVQIEV